jgi:hypothetical protein
MKNSQKDKGRKLIIHSMIFLKHLLGNKRDPEDRIRSITTSGSCPQGGYILVQKTGDKQVEQLYVVISRLSVQRLGGLEKITKAVQDILSNFPPQFLEIVGNADSDSVGQGWA